MSWQETVTVLVSLVVLIDSHLTRDQMLQLSLKARKLPNDVCGKSTMLRQNIINGTAIELGEYPWAAAIGYTGDSDGPEWFCGGSLVTDQLVVTAAHCLVGDYGRVIMVRLGDLNLNDTVKDGASPVDFEVESTKIHPDFNSYQNINDIGIIKLKRKVTFDFLKKPICLPSPDFFFNPFVGYSTTVIGWGMTEKGRTTVLYGASLAVQDVNTCRTNISRVFPDSIVDNRVICASASGKDSCQGDSGGPLMTFRRYKGRSKIFLLGVVSYGYGCAIEDYPGVYTRVSHFMNWILDNLEL